MVLMMTNAKKQYERSFGPKYNRDLTNTQIAALIRADLKAATKAGEIPMGFKYSVRKSGNSIDLEIVAVPAGFRILSETALRGEYGPERYRQTEEARALLDKLKAIHGAYNHDGSDIQSDYFDVNYYGHPKFDWQLEDAERTAAEAVAS